MVMFIRYSTLMLKRPRPIRREHTIMVLSDFLAIFGAPFWARCYTCNAPKVWNLKTPRNVCSLGQFNGPTLYRNKVFQKIQGGPCFQLIISSEPILEACTSIVRASRIIFVYIFFYILSIIDTGCTHTKGIKKVYDRCLLRHTC